MKKLSLIACLVMACADKDENPAPNTDTGGDTAENEEVDADSDGFPASEDCNDSDASINPAAPGCAMASTTTAAVKPTKASPVIGSRTWMGMDLATPM